MKKKLSEIAALLGGALKGDSEIWISGLATLDEAGPGDLTFVMGAQYAEAARKTRASAIVVSEGLPPPPHIPSITVKDANVSLARLAQAVEAELERIPREIHSTANIKGKVGKDVSIGAFCTVEAGAQVGDGTTLWPNVYVGRDAKIGPNCRIYANVSIRDRSEIGANVIIHSGTVIGCDGFGFAQVQGKHLKIPQLGRVVIGDDVEIGANGTIARARFGKTSIGRGTKLDCLVHVGHNVSIGEHCIIIAQVGIAGSVVIGNGVMIGGQVGVSDHIKIGDGAKIAGQTAIMSDVSPGAVLSGSPARDHREHLKQIAALKRLPELLRQVKQLRDRIEGR